MIVNVETVLHLLEWYAVVTAWCLFWITWVLDG